MFNFIKFFNMLRGNYEFGNTIEIAEFASVLFFLCAIVGMIFFGVIFFKGGSLAKATKGAVVFVVFVIVGGTTAILFKNKYMDDFTSKVENMISEGCKVFIDGQVVDPEKIVMENYAVYIKEDTIVLVNKK